jgi:hypothetical protein
MLENADNRHAGAPSHLDVLRRISDIDARAGLQTKLLNGELKLKGMGLAAGHPVTEDAHRKKRVQSKCADLGANTQATAAAD